MPTPQRSPLGGPFQQAPRAAQVRSALEGGVVHSVCITTARLRLRPRCGRVQLAVLPAQALLQLLACGARA